MRGALGILAIALCLGAASAATGQQVDFALDDTLELRGEDIEYRLDLSFSPVAPTRIEIDALLDLRDFQEELSRITAGEILIDMCRNVTEIEELRVVAVDQSVQITGDIRTRRFECLGGLRSERQRGAQVKEVALDFNAVAGLIVTETCFIFDLQDLNLKPVSDTRVFDTPPEVIDAVRTLALEAARLVLQSSPFCPELPPELQSLDPVFKSGGLREIEEGGVGVNLVGTIDVSTSTIIEVLRVLQAESIIPAAP